MITDAATFTPLPPNRFSKKSGMVLAWRCRVMIRVRRPNTTQASSEPMMALPRPIQVALTP